MIYLDSAAPSLQKPPEVARAMAPAVSRYASPGRGGYSASAAAAECAFRCRTELAGLLGAAGPEQIIFTSSATHGLNIAIRSLVSSGDQVVISGYEHNAVTRTLESIPNLEVRVAATKLFSQEADLEAFRSQIDRQTKAVICTHVSNVFGYILPIGEIATLCRERGVPLIVDASQSAGVLPVKTEEWKAAYVAMPGHKGLYGPQGTGILACGKESNPTPLLTGGTGSESRMQQMPSYLPDSQEAGTHNMPGIAGLHAGVQFVRRIGTERILAHERQLIRTLAEQLNMLPDVKLYLPGNRAVQSGVLSFRIEGRDCETVSEQLGQRGIALRAGLHCAPLAHQLAGTSETGTIRASVSPFTRQMDVMALAAALRNKMEI